MLDRWFTDAEIKEWERAFSRVLHVITTTDIADLVLKLEHTVHNDELQEKLDGLLATHTEAAWLANLRDADALGKLTTTALPAMYKLGNNKNNAATVARSFELRLNIRTLVARLEDLAMAVETLEHSEARNETMLTASNYMRIVVNSLWIHKSKADVIPCKASVKAMRVVNFQRFILPAVDKTDVSTGKTAWKAVSEEAHALYGLLCNIEHAL